MNDAPDPDLQARFDQFDQVEPPDVWARVLADAETAPTRRSRAGRLALAAALVLAVAGVGALLVSRSGDEDGLIVTPGEQAPSTSARLGSDSSLPVKGPPPTDPFVPPSVESDDGVRYDITLLDGSKVDVTLPDELDFNPTHFEAAATLTSAVASDLPPIRIDVTWCPECSDANTVHFEGWAVTGSGDRLNAPIWAAYTDLIDGEVTDDGSLVLSGPISLGPIDSPDANLVDGDDQVSLFLRDCATGPRPHNAAGIGWWHKPYTDFPGITSFCAAHEAVEVRLTGMIAIDDPTMADSVGVDVETIGPSLQRAIDTVNAEATDIPFPICWELPEDGPPEGQSLDELEALHQLLEADGIQNLDFLGGYSGPSNVWGRDTVMLRRRHQPTIDWLTERADPDQLCLDLPPEGWYDQAPVPAAWTLAPASQPPDDHWQNLTLLVTQADCGLLDPSRILEPEIDYRPDAITIAVPLRVAEWGPTILPCPAPNPITVALTEPPNGRPLKLAD